jgi:hypothetical protein
MKKIYLCSGKVAWFCFGIICQSARAGICIVFLILCFFPLHKVLAQSNFNKADHLVEEPAGKDLLFQNNAYYFLSNRGVYKYSASGQLTWFSAFQGDFYGDRLFSARNGDIIVIGNSTVCDVPDFILNFLSRIDSNGTIKFAAQHSVSTQSSPEFYNSIVEKVDSTYYLFTNDHAFHVDQSGIILNKLLLNTKIYGSALSMNNEIILSNQTGGNLYLSRYSHALNFKSQTSSPVRYQNLRTNGNEFFGLSDSGVLYRIDSTLQILDSSFSSIPDKIKNFKIEDDTLYLVTTSAKYLLASLNFSVLHQSTCLTNSISQQDVVYNGSKTAVLSTCNSSHTFSASNEFYSLNVFDKLGSNNFQHDIGVTAVSADAFLQVIYTVTLSGWPTVNVQKVSINNATVTVKNFGSVPVNSFKINYKNPVPTFCEFVFFQKSYNVTIAPGDSVTINTGPLTYGYAENQSSYHMDLCFYTTVPDYANDKKIENDGYCLSTIVYAGLGEENFEQFITVFPNPTSSGIHVSSVVDLHKIILIDLFGRQVLSKQINGKDTELDLKEISAGVYFLRAEGENITMVKKVIRE